MELLAIFLFGIAFCLIPAAIAKRKGRTPWKAFLLSLIASPIIGFIVVLILERKKECPYCAERIFQAATICKNCGKELTAKQVN